MSEKRPPRLDRTERAKRNTDPFFGMTRPMSDLTERLRNPTWTFPEAEDISVLDSTATKVMTEAADEIERLTEALTKTRTVASSMLGDVDGKLLRISEIAITALNGGPDQ